MWINGKICSVNPDDIEVRLERMKYRDKDRKIQAVERRNKKIVYKRKTEKLVDECEKLHS